MPDEMRTLLRAARKRRPPKPTVDHLAAITPDADPGTDGTSAPPSAPAHAPLPPLTPERATRIADDVIRAALRTAGAPVNSPLSRLRRERGLGGKGTRLPLGHTVRLSDVPPEPVRWLWPGRLPAGKLTLLDGDPGLGKSTLLCELAARIARGDPLPGAETEPGAPRGVLLFSAEDGPYDTIRPRIEAAGGDPRRIVAFLAVPDGSETGRPFALPRDLPILAALVEKIDAALVVFDPLVDYLPAGVSPQSLQRVRHAMGALRASAERTGAAVVGVRHLTKSGGANPLYRGLGSIGSIAAARSGLLLAADPANPERRILALSKGNLTRPAASLAFRLEEVPGASVARLVWDGESPLTATQLLHAQRDAAGDGAARRSVVDEARTWLREALADGPRLAVELREDAAAHGIGEKALYAARRAERITVAKERILHGRWVWALETAPGQGELEFELDLEESPSSIP
jgi:AAA domain